MSCKEQTSKKYTERPSPPIKAGDCPNQKKKGNDGLCYISTPNKNGVFRWVKVKTSKTSSKRVTSSEPKTKRVTTSKKECRPDQERNPKTGRCKKVKSVRTSMVTERRRTPSVRRPSVRRPSVRRPSVPRTPSVRRPSVKKTVPRKGILDRLNPFKKAPLHDDHPALTKHQLRDETEEDRRSRFLPDGAIPMVVKIPENPSRKDQFGFNVVFVPVFTRPVFNDWIFYDVKTNQFRQPTFGSKIGNKFIPEEKVLDHIHDRKSEVRARVFVVNGDFGEFSRDSEFL